MAQGAENATYFLGFLSFFPSRGGPSSNILQLASLLDSSFCTIPTTAKSLEIQFERPSPGKKLGPPTFTSEDVTTAIATMFEHFQSFEVTISLNLPWTFSRYLDWYYINPYTSLRKLVAAGTFIWLSDFTQFLHHVPTLECLIIDASFKTVEACRVPSRLKEAGRPDSLHILRVKIDSVQAHIRTFYHLIPFLKMYGRELAHLYVWFEEIGTISHDDVSVFEVVSEALDHTINLEHLELLFPAMRDEEDVQAAVALILPPSSRRPANLRIRAGDEVGMDEAEFWEAPSQVCDVGEEREFFIVQLIVVASASATSPQRGPAAGEALANSQGTVKDVEANPLRVLVIGGGFMKGPGAFKTQPVS
ncbi:hypothetical protein FA13DRAFT_1710455 [Coprinellus micaceus]|uniref:F-box domain-containing protein n=1 Tax=Coprinellus micaceus TaxID=71717 RepID=A0A4Y7T8F9_COPMI|nr:hypothetical protein FA13DRAFT_1710455 [Coprinellus micaceus]